MVCIQALTRSPSQSQPSLLAAAPFWDPTHLHICFACLFFVWPYMCSPCGQPCGEFGTKAVGDYFHNEPSCSVSAAVPRGMVCVMKISFSLSNTSCPYITCATNMALYEISDNYCMKLKPGFQSARRSAEIRNVFSGCYHKSRKAAENIKIDNSSFR